MIIVSLSSPPLHTHTYIGRRDLIPNPIHIPDGALAGVRKSISPRILRKKGSFGVLGGGFPLPQVFFVCSYFWLLPGQNSTPGLGLGIVWRLQYLDLSSASPLLRFPTLSHNLPGAKTV